MSKALLEEIRRDNMKLEKLRARKAADKLLREERGLAPASKPSVQQQMLETSLAGVTMDLGSQSGENVTTTVGADAAASTPAQKIARMTARGVADETICQMYGLQQVELNDMRADAEYTAALEVGFEKEVATPINIDDKWDSIEDQALSKLHNVVDDTYDPDELLKIAGMANRAVRKKNGGGGKDRDLQVGGGNKTNIVNVTFSPTFVQQLDSINPAAERQRIIEASKSKKMVDFMSQDKLEGLIAERGLSQVSEVADALDAIEELSLGE